MVLGAGVRLGGNILFIQLSWSAGNIAVRADCEEGICCTREERPSCLTVN